ncbi:MAG: RNA chaperone Hfq [Tissierellales bacterium]|nr:RNA chaperone Hfq [Tissierellales bacterium]MBN2828323.1 RNA chaperone Hfq [Tissierellales bacterium]
MKQIINLQDSFLNQARKDKIGLTIFLTNGVKLKGFVKGFDNYAVIFDMNDKHQLIYKHAISTIIPDTNINVQTNNE